MAVSAFFRATDAQAKLDEHEHCFEDANATGSSVANPGYSKVGFVGLAAWCRWGHSSAKLVLNPKSEEGD